MKKTTAKNWVKVISIFGYIAAALMILVGLFMFVGGALLSTVLSLAPINFGEQITGVLFGVALIVAAITSIVIGLLVLLVSVNLWRYKNWARIVLIIVSVIGAVSGLATLPGGVIKLLIWGGVFYLLALNKDVKKLFKR